MLSTSAAARTLADFGVTVYKNTTRCSGGIRYGSAGRTFRVYRTGNAPVEIMTQRQVNQLAQACLDRIADES